MVRMPEILRGHLLFARAICMIPAAGLVPVFNQG